MHHHFTVFYMDGVSPYLACNSFCLRVGCGMVSYGFPVEEMPKNWYNELADSPFELDPPLNPTTREPVKSETLLAIFSSGNTRFSAADRRFVYRCFPWEETFEAAKLFAHFEGIVPASEASHAVATVIRKAKSARKERREEVIVFQLEWTWFCLIPRLHLTMSQGFPQGNEKAPPYRRG